MSEPKDTGWKYYITDYSDDGDWHPLMAWEWQRVLDAEDAAELAADDNYCDLEYPDVIENLMVKSPKGVITAWDVSVEMEPQFSASQTKA